MYSVPYTYMFIFTYARFQIFINSISKYLISSKRQHDQSAKIIEIINKTGNLLTTSTISSSSADK